MAQRLIIFGIMFLLTMHSALGLSVSEILADIGIFQNNVTIGSGTNTIEMNGTTGNINTIGNFESLGNITAQAFYTLGGEVQGLLTVQSNTSVNAITIDNNNIDTIAINDEGNITITGNMTANNYYGNKAIITGERSEFTAGNGKIVTTNSGGAIVVNGDSNGGAIDFSGNTASIGISADGISNNYDYDGAMIFKQKAANPDEIGEYIFIEENGDWRFALPSSGADYGTYNPRSMIIAGASVNNASNFHCSYWGFNNLDCNTGVTGADLGVQDDLEVLGLIYGNGSQLTDIGTYTHPDTIDLEYDGTGSTNIPLEADRTLTHSVGFLGDTITGIDIDNLITVTGASFLFTDQVGLDIVLDTTETTFTGTNGQQAEGIKVSVAIDDAPAGGYHTGSEGIDLVISADRTASIFGAYTKAINKNTGQSIGYQGYGSNTGAGTGLTAIGVYGFASSNNGIETGLLASSFGTGTDDYSFYSVQGHMWSKDGNLYITNSTAITTNYDRTHVNTTHDGSLYVEGVSEFDSHVYFDGGYGDIAETYHTSYSANKVEEVIIDQMSYTTNQEGEIIEIPLYTTETKMSDDFIPEFTGGEIICLTINGLIKECDRHFDNYFIGIISTNPNLIITHHKHGYPVAELGIVKTNANCNKNWENGESVYAGNKELLTLADAQAFPLNWDNFDRMQGARIGRIAGECENGKIPIFID